MSGGNVEIQYNPNQELLIRGFNLGSVDELKSPKTIRAAVAKQLLKDKKKYAQLVSDPDNFTIDLHINSKDKASITDGINKLKANQNDYKENRDGSIVFTGLKLNSFLSNATISTLKAEMDKERAKSKGNGLLGAIIPVSLGLTSAAGFYFASPQYLGQVPVFGPDLVQRQETLHRNINPALQRLLNQPPQRQNPNGSKNLPSESNLPSGQNNP